MDISIIDCSKNIFDTSIICKIPKKKSLEFPLYMVLLVLLGGMSFGKC